MGLIAISFFLDIIRQGGDIKKKNLWIQHVQDYSKENSIGYLKALSDPKCKAQYRMRLWLLTIIDYRLLWTIDYYGLSTIMDYLLTVCGKS
jgi:hypothetical protein